MANSMTAVVLYVSLFRLHYNDVTMGAIASQITSPTFVYSIVFSDADQRKHQSSASLALCGEFTGPGLVNFPHKWLVMRKMFPFDDVIMGSHIHYKQFAVYDDSVRGKWFDPGLKYGYFPASSALRLQSFKLGTKRFMMTSWNGNVFLVTGPLWRVAIGHRWIPLTKGQ